MPASSLRPLDFRSAALYCVGMVLVWLTGWSIAEDLQLPGEYPRSLSLVLLMLASAATVYRKRRPAVVLVVTGLCSTAAMLLTGEFGAVFLQFETVYTGVLYGSRRLARGTTFVCLGITGALGAAALIRIQASPLWFAALLQATVVLLLPLLWAWEVRHHRDARTQAEIAAEAQHQLAIREHELAEARTALRVQEHSRRIAQDLHDGVAGHLSAVALQTAALRTDGMRDASPETRERVLDSIRTASVAALAEMRSLIDVLRQDFPQDPGPGVRVDSLEARLRASFPQARVRIDAGARELLDAASTPSAQAALRVVQEATTNVLKHAAEGPVELALGIAGCDTGEELTLRCTSAMAPAGAEAGGGFHDAGLGLRSMRLRTAQAGGRFAAGPDDTGSRWVVTASWPEPRSHDAGAGAGAHRAGTSSAGKDIAP